MTRQMRFPLLGAMVALGMLSVLSASQFPPSGDSPAWPDIRPDVPPDAPPEPPRGTVRPHLPLAQVDTTMPPATGAIITVTAGADLQLALNAARPGDTLALEPGAVYRGSYRLSTRAGPGTILITTSGSLKPLPPAGTRIDPSFAGHLAIIESDGPRPALVIPAGVSGYRFVGLEIRPEPGSFVADLVTISASPQLATTGSIVFDRCYVHGDAVLGARRGIAMNGGATAVIDSYFTDFKDAVNDSQALAGWGGTGPFAILNNHLEAAGENVLFGGADPTTPGLVPSDIEIRHNHFTKPLSWKVDDPSYGGSRWSVKNLLELKNAQRVVIDGNIFEHAWRAAQSGFAILFTVRNQDGRAPWSTVTDVTFTNNIVRHATSGINILGKDDIRTSQTTQRILIGNNLFEDIGGVWGAGRLFQVLNGAEDVTFEHNTAVTRIDSFLMGGDTTPHPRATFIDNIVFHDLYGLFGGATAVGLSSMERYFPAMRFARNVIVGGSAARYPADQFFPASASQVGFVDFAGQDYRLGNSSPYLTVATDGTAAGVDHARLRAATAGADRATVVPAPVPLEPPGDGLIADPFAAGQVARPVLWASVLLLAWTYAGYPAVMVLWGRVRPRPVRRQRIEPPVSVLVIAQNEGAAIAARIENLLHLDYPADRLEIVIASDGSTDETVAIARRAGSPRVQVIAFAERRGKAQILNEVVPGLTGEIAVLADTRQRIDTGAIRALVAPFADAGVGAVSGELMLDCAPGDALGGVGGYWRYEKLIRQGESHVDSSIAATGALYAIRRTLFDAIPPDTILDDVLIPLRIAKQGYRIIFEPTARVFDRMSPTAHGEFGRKVRTCAGNVQLLARESWLLLPWRNRLWFQTLSHKVLRLALPLLHAVAFGTSLLLARESGVSMALVVAQAGFLALALLGATGRLRWAGPLVSVPYAICLLNCATLAGMARFVLGRQPVTWQRTVTSPTMSPPVTGRPLPHH